MTEDLTSLQIRILYDDVTQAERRLSKLEKTSKKTGKAFKNQERNSKSLMGSILKLAGAYITLRGAGMALRAIIRTTAEFQQLNAQLETATGTAEDAVIAFAAIKDFAQQTPFDLQQATGAFISLVNRGLTPSERALRSYGNTASAMGFQLQDMVLAVSNATAGEFETLKRFGIRAKKTTDGISFTFRGVTQEVGNNIKEIEEFFIGLGEKDFAGGMERQMNTLNGAFSNFGDAWEVMLATVGEAGIGDAIEEGVRFATELIEDFTAAMESGEIEATLDSWRANFRGFGEVAADVWDSVGEGMASFIDFSSEALGMHSDDINDEAVEPWDKVEDVLEDIPIWFSTMLKLVSATLDTLGESIFEITEQIRLGFTGAIEAAAATSRAAQFSAQGKAVKDPVVGPPGSGTGSFEGGNTLGALQDFAFNESKARQKEQLEFMQENVFKTGAGLEEELFDAWEDAILEGSDQIVDRELAKQSAKELRAKFDRERKARGEDQSDRLERFRIGGDGDGAGSEAKKKAGKAKLSEFERLVRSLQDEEKLISESFRRRFVSASVEQAWLWKAWARSRGRLSGTVTLPSPFRFATTPFFSPRKAHAFRVWSLTLPRPTRKYGCWLPRGLPFQGLRIASIHGRIKAQVLMSSKQRAEELNRICWGAVYTSTGFANWSPW